MRNGFDVCVEEIEREVRLFAQREEDRIKEALNTPYPPASNPGQHPHRRTGTLRGNIKADVERTGDVLSITVVSPTPYTEPLESSGRPVLSDRVEELESGIVESVESPKT